MDDIFNLYMHHVETCGQPKNLSKICRKKNNGLDMLRVNLYEYNNDSVNCICITKVSIRNKMIFSSNATIELPFNIAHI